MPCTDWSANVSWLSVTVRQETTIVIDTIWTKKVKIWSASMYDWAKECHCTQVEHLPHGALGLYNRCDSFCLQPSPLLSVFMLGLRKNYTKGSMFWLRRWFVKQAVAYPRHFASRLRLLPRGCFLSSQPFAWALTVSDELGRSITALPFIETSRRYLLPIATSVISSLADKSSSVMVFNAGIRPHRCGFIHQCVGGSHKSKLRRIRWYTVLILLHTELEAFISSFHLTRMATQAIELWIEVEVLKQPVHKPLPAEKTSTLALTRGFWILFQQMILFTLRKSSMPSLMPGPSRDFGNHSWYKRSKKQPDAAITEFQSNHFQMKAQWNSP